MKKDLTKVSTVGMSREEWLERRTHTIGGSDAAAIIGLNKWSSPYSVWADKLCKLPPKEDNEAMRLGRDLEDYVAKRFTEAVGKKVRRENAMLYNPDYPFAHADVDRMVIGEDAGLECKTTSVLNLKQFKGGEYPAHYYVQCVHYLAVTGCQRWYLGVLVLGQGFYHYVIERDEAEIEALMSSEAEFWKLVESRTPPMADGSEATSEAIKAVFKESNDSEVDLTAYNVDLEAYDALGKRIKELETQRDEIGNKIKSYMGESGRGSSAGFKVTWTSSSRSTFDSKRFQKDNPSLDLTKYNKTSSTRTFRVTKLLEN